MEIDAGKNGSGGELELAPIVAVQQESMLKGSDKNFSLVFRSLRR